MKKITKKIKEIQINLSDKLYHSRHRKRALKVLKNIESVKGKTNKKLITLSDEYAKDVLGSKKFAPWLYVYSAISEKFKEGWIPDNYYGRIVVPKLKGNYGDISTYNSLTTKLFKCADFPNFAYFTNGLWLSPEYNVLSKKEILKTIHNEESRLLYKTDSSSKGKGVYFLKKENLKIDDLELLGNGVMQRYINQHPFFQDISPNSVATLRITSVINNNGQVTINASYLRVGRNSDTHVKSNSHIRIPVNFNTGELDRFGYTTNWLRITEHPDTKYIFNNKKIPHFDKFIAKTIKLHKMVPFTRCIGWDMIVDNKNEIQVMEWNGSHNDIKFSEATQGPCFSNLGWNKLYSRWESNPHS
tara:strand:+ start:39 stop:1112 length:1074 start_codon:yes stop_codon:yes gene_type:complete